jgi:prepilin-type processing-associated H-X9-DG protein
VELLVVIGIIALLISILLPSLNKARQSANNVKCQSNMRQQGQLLQLYLNGFDAYPTGATEQGSWAISRDLPVKSDGSGASWIQLLTKYTMSDMVEWRDYASSDWSGSTVQEFAVVDRANWIFSCPDDLFFIESRTPPSGGAASTWSGEFDNLVNKGGRGMSYTANPEVMGSFGWNDWKHEYGRTPPVAAGRVEDASKAAVILEKRGNFGWGDYAIIHREWLPLMNGWWGQDHGALYARHGRQDGQGRFLDLNVLYADGHVGQRARQQVIDMATETLAPDFDRYSDAGRFWHVRD